MNHSHDTMQDNPPTHQATIEPDIAALEKKEKYNRLFRRGCTWVGLGVMLLGISFGVTFMLFQSDKSFMIIMYVLTSIGATCVIKGLVDIIG
ncbi:MAG: hypothetical protein JNL70_18095 [Saprospiraceae bacterium]|nr:hypothetical protein [Saprospiraceae bacterium]